jgi:mono/diheme cytochrome c family protein
LFNDNCAACHQRTGQGVPGAFPALAGNPFVQGPHDELAATVLLGRGGMPAYANELTDEQLAAVLTYLRGAWGNTAAPVTTEDIAAARAKADAAAKPKDLLAH